LPYRDPTAKMPFRWASHRLISAFWSVAPATRPGLSPLFMGCWVLQQELGQGKTSLADSDGSTAEIDRSRATDLLVAGSHPRDLTARSVDPHAKHTGKKSTRAAGDPNWRPVLPPERCRRARGARVRERGLTWQPTTKAGSDVYCGELAGAPRAMTRHDPLPVSYRGIGKR
jgi:hypothetical protein